MNPEALHAAAQTYAGWGWPVFPCKPGGKTPLTEHGCLAADTDADMIRVWWRYWPMANVAIACGAPGPDVLDVDVKDVNGYDALDLLRLVGLLSGPIANVRTPSGGMHLYYIGSDQANGKLTRHGLDFRSRGGYVIAPPSVIDGRPYAMVECRERGRAVDWQAIRRFLDPPRPVVRNTDRGNGNLGALARWVEQQQPGNRNDALFWAARTALESGHTDLDDLAAAAMRAGLDEREVHRTIQSATRRGGAE